MNLDVVIAERVLDGTFQGQPCKVTVKFGQPFFEDGAWCCPHSIGSPVRNIAHSGFGVDSLQALLISISVALVDLKYLKVDGLNWEGNPDLGFVIHS